MPHRERRAGQNIRQLALERRVKSITSLIGAGLFAFSPFFLLEVIGALLRRFTANSLFLARFFSYSLPIVYGTFLVVSLLLTSRGVRLWKMANRADQGAKGEEIVSQELVVLKKEGWKFEYGMRLANSLGDADIVCVSPREKAYVIDVKSHKGEVTVDGQQLSRRMGRTSYLFEKDFIRQIMRQAFQVKEQKRFGFVTPILVFSQARVTVPNDKMRNVYVVEREKLASLLRSLG